MKNTIKEALNFINYFSLKNFISLSNKHVFIVGSAPKLNLDHFSDDKVIISCNGSALNAKKNNLPDPVLTIVDNELIDKDIATTKPSRSVIVKNELLKDMYLGKLISVQSNYSKGGSPEILKANYSNFKSVNKNVRKMILKKILKVNWIEDNDLSLASTGGFTIALCAFLKAKTITFEGFNLFQEDGNDLKHFYESDKIIQDVRLKNNTKAHSLADSIIIGCLAARGIKLYSSEKDFFPLLNNWGQPKFKYKKDD